MQTSSNNEGTTNLPLWKGRLRGICSYYDATNLIYPSHFLKKDRIKKPSSESEEGFLQVLMVFFESILTGIEYHNRLAGGGNQSLFFQGL